jgi:hypothetical protein
VTVCPLMVMFTLGGIAMGRFPIRDISCLLDDDDLPNVAKHFATHSLFAGIAIGHDATRGRDDCNANSTQDSGQIFVVGINAQTGLADPFQATDQGLAPISPFVFERDDQIGFDPFAGFFDFTDKAFRFQHGGNTSGHLGGGYLGCFMSQSGVTDARQHICNGVVY